MEDEIVKKKNLKQDLKQNNSNKKNGDQIWKIKINKRGWNWKIFVILWLKCVLIIFFKECDSKNRHDLEKKKVDIYIDKKKGNNKKCTVKKSI
jgi:hypothetical protein